jgi:uncharacterized protein YecE (DUF72 family)
VITHAQLWRVATIRFGTSGYAYDSWRGLLYPRRLPKERWLTRYAEVFPSVELNTTFYGLPRPGSIQRWREVTTSGFSFAVKGSQWITHRKRLLEPEESLRRFFDLLDGLGEKLAVVLWQLPPSMKEPDLPRLRAFLAALPRSVRHAIEFRSGAWHVEEVCAALGASGAAIVEHDLVREPVPRPTGGFRYLRFHGSTARYRGRYGRAALRPFARSLRRWRDEGRDAFVYFNNDLEGHALADALDLGDLLGDDRPRLAYGAPADGAPAR